MQTEDYLSLDFKDLTALPPLNRREFFQRFGAGIFIFLSVSDWLEAQEGGRQRGSGARMPTDFNAFLRIGENGRVTCFSGKIEMGQGLITSLAQMLAEELDVALDTVDMVLGDTDQCPWDMGTFGSMSTRFFGPPLRAAAAEAKAVLLDLAAESLQVPKSQLAAQQGAVVDQQNPRHKVTYAQLAKGQKIARHVTAQPKDFAEFKLVGKSELRRDALAKVTGQAQYAGDIRLPGMLYARLVRPPAHDATFKTADTAPAKQIPGVQIVREGDFIAVLHEQPDLAEKALEKIKASYEVPPAQFDDQSIFDHLLKVAPPPTVVARGGDLEAGKKAARETIAATYYNSYVAHAPIETHTALAKIEDGKATVWASTQNPFGAQGEIARALGFPAEKVRVITPFVGGGFGGKTRNTQAVEAARLAKATGRPVQVAWTRAEEFFYDTFRPAAIVKINSGIDADGRIAFWDYEVVFAGERGSQQFYAISHHRTTARGAGWQGPPGSHPFATGPWRAPANNTNTFARESHIDLLAARAGLDPVAFRLKNLRDPRMIGVLKAAAGQFGWTPAKAPSKRGYGVACGIDAGTYVATLLELELNRAKGTVQVKRVVCAQDMGTVINPAGARLQMEGCVTMGLGYSLTEEIHFRGGQIQQNNFDSYELPRFSWVPKIETVLVDAQGAPPQGGGEPAIITLGAAIANALHDAAGLRLYQLPMTPARIKKALTN